MPMINLYIEIADLVSESARLATGEETQMPSARLALRCNRYLKHVPEESIVHEFLNELARSGA